MSKINVEMWTRSFFNVKMTLMSVFSINCDPFGQFSTWSKSVVTLAPNVAKDYWYIYCSHCSTRRIYNFERFQTSSYQVKYEPHRDKTNKMACAPSLIRVFAVRLKGSKGPKLSSSGQGRLWSDWADAQADLSLRWAHSHFVGFVMMRLNY